MFSSASSINSARNGGVTVVVAGCERRSGAQTVASPDPYWSGARRHILAIYVTFSPPGAPTVDTLQGRLFLPLAALLPLALPQVPSFGTRMVPWAAAGFSRLVS